jgi:hypothetical protein
MPLQMYGRNPDWGEETQLREFGEPGVTSALSNEQQKCMYPGPKLGGNQCQHWQALKKKKPIKSEVFSRTVMCLNILYKLEKVLQKAVSIVFKQVRTSYIF